MEKPCRRIKEADEWWHRQCWSPFVRAYNLSMFCQMANTIRFPLIVGPQVNLQAHSNYSVPCNVSSSMAHRTEKDVDELGFTRYMSLH